MATQSQHTMAATPKTAKVALRKQAKALRAALPERYRLDAAERLSDYARPLLDSLTQGGTVGLYWPLDGELDSRFLLPLIDRLGLTAALPVVTDRDGPLIFRVFALGDPLKDGPFGTRQPGAEAPSVKPDMLFVPLLAFDAGCYRLGYGGGYYDRTLAGFTSVRAFGLAFSAQLVDIMPREPHDIPLHGVLTEEGLVVPGHRHPDT